MTEATPPVRFPVTRGLLTLLAAAVRGLVMLLALAPLFAVVAVATPVLMLLELLAEFGAPNNPEVSWPGRLFWKLHDLTARLAPKKHEDVFGCAMAVGLVGYAFLVCLAGLLFISPAP